MEKTVQKIPFLRITLALGAGILIQSLFPLNTVVLIGFLIFSFAAMILIHRYYNFRRSLYFGILLHLFFIAAGVLIMHFYNKPPQFYKNGKFYATLIEIPQEKENSFQTVLQIEAFQKKDSVFRTNEKIIAWFEKNEKAETLKPGDKIVFNRKPQRVSNYNNPFEFDYKAYLERKRIFRQVYLPANKWFKNSNSTSLSIPVAAENVRNRLLKIYKNQQMGENEVSILSALTLGYKKDLDRETKNIFASAGAMHVLAVSGLHVGIIFIALQFLFGFLRRQDPGKIIYILTVIFILWFYAFLTGLSPSVTRASTMFTFVVIGTTIRRQLNIYNTLAASAFFILLFNPNNLFEVGFQLSYAAVFGIVFLQPKFFNLIHFKYKFFRYCWGLLTVSLAAQIATFPIAVYYFNQFPVYFWISNLFIIPAVTVFIPLGISLLFLHGIPFLADILAWTIDFLIGKTYYLLQFIERLPHSKLEFTFLPAELISVIGILLCLFIFIETKNKLYFKGALTFALFLTLTVFAVKARNLFRKEIIVYNQSGSTVVQLIKGENNYVVSDTKLATDGFKKDMIMNTVFRYRLDTPIFLNQSETYEDGLLFLKKGFICFEGRMIHLASEQNLNYKNLTPDYIIGSSINTKNLNFQKQVPKYILTQPGYNKVKNTGINYYSLVQNGAYTEKW